MALVAELWSDGSGTMQRSPGGWAYILRAIRDGEVVSQKEAHGGLEDTTNNRAELTAVIEGLLALNRSTAITVFSDSEYVCKGATSWLPQWQRNGWRTREGEVATGTSGSRSRPRARSTRCAFSGSPGTRRATATATGTARSRRARA